MIMSGFRAALDLDTYPLSNLIRPPCAERAKPCRGKPVHIGFFACFHAIQQNRHIFFLALVALKLLVSLISRLVACSATQNDYCNPRCACAPRVNNTYAQYIKRYMYTIASFPGSPPLARNYCWTFEDIKFYVKNSILHSHSHTCTIKHDTLIIIQ